MEFIIISSWSEDIINITIMLEEPLMFFNFRVFNPDSFGVAMIESKEKIGYFSPKNRVAIVPPLKIRYSEKNLNIRSNKVI